MSTTIVKDIFSKLQGQSQGNNLMEDFTQAMISDFSVKRMPMPTQQTQSLLRDHQAPALGQSFNTQYLSSPSPNAPARNYPAGNLSAKTFMGAYLGEHEGPHSDIMILPERSSPR
jgi:hypothetical protein